MKTTTTNLLSPLVGLGCAAFGHDYIVTQKVTNHINEYQCSHCGKEVTDNVTGHLADLNFKTKKINQSLAMLFQKKRQRMTPTH